MACLLQGDTRSSEGSFFLYKSPCFYSFPTELVPQAKSYAGETTFPVGQGAANPSDSLRKKLEAKKSRSNWNCCTLCATNSTTSTDLGCSLTLLCKTSSQIDIQGPASLLQMFLPTTSLFLGRTVAITYSCAPGRHWAAGYVIAASFCGLQDGFGQGNTGGSLKEGKHMLLPISIRDSSKAYAESLASCINTSPSKDLFLQPDFTFFMWLAPACCCLHSAWIHTCSC